MKRSQLLGIISLTLSLAALHAADDPVTSVQRSLKDLGFHYADPTAKMDEETRGALKRFQIRDGLKVTGEIDNETLQALARASAAAPRAAGSESAPPSARERALRTEISDREFLGNLQAGEGGEASVSPQVVPAPVAEPPPSPRPRAVSPPAPPIGSPDRSSDELAHANAASFVQSYLKAAESPRPDAEISFYAEHVDYFDSGRVSRQFVARDQASYYRRWPNREFTLLDPPQLLSSNGKRATVRFRMRYKLSSGQERASGTTENVVQLQQKNDGFKISGIQERKVRD